MTQFDFTKLFGSDLSQILTPPANFLFDVNVLAETQRKNMQALGEAQRVTMENLQAVAQHQAEILSRFVQDQSSLTQELLTASSPEQKAAKQAELLKKSYDKSVTAFQELATLIAQSNKTTSDIINKRISASLSEVKLALEKSKAAPKKAA